MKNPKIALLIVYHHEADVMPAMRAAILRQTVQPQEVWFGITGSNIPCPELEAEWRLVRSPKKYDGQFSKGFVVNEVAKQTNTEWLLLLDGDCVPCPEWVEWYTKVTSGWMSEYMCSDDTVHVLLHKERLNRTMFNGPRLYAPTPLVSWEALIKTAKKQYYGFRARIELVDGKDEGSAMLAFCNCAFPVKMLRQVPLQEVGRQEDARWARDVRKGAHGWFKPSPDQAIVVHIGPESNGRGLE